MPRGRSGFRGRGISQAQRRKKTWVPVGEIISAGQTPGIATSFLISLTTPATIGQATRNGFIVMVGDGTGASPLTSTLESESTILRIRGSLLFPKTTFTSGTGVQIQFSFGIGITAISDLQAASYPGPISDADWDGWMFLRQSGVAPADSVGTMMDVKAMRKINDGEALFVMAEGLNVGATAVQADWLVDLRVLLLLP